MLVSSDDGGRVESVGWEGGNGVRRIVCEAPRWMESYSYLTWLGLAWLDLAGVMARLLDLLDLLDLLG